MLEDCISSPCIMKLWVQHQHHQEPSSVLEQQIEPYIISTCFPPLKLCYYRCEKADKYCPLNSCAYETVQGLDTLRQQWWICAPDTCISWMAPPKGQVCWGGDNQGMLPWLPRHMQCPSPPVPLESTQALCLLLMTTHF